MSTKHRDATPQGTAFSADAIVAALQAAQQQLNDNDPLHPASLSQQSGAEGDTHLERLLASGNTHSFNAEKKDHKAESKAKAPASQPQDGRAQAASSGKSAVDGAGPFGGVVLGAVAVTAAAIKEAQEAEKETSVDYTPKPASDESDDDESATTLNVEKPLSEADAAMAALLEPNGAATAAQSSADASNASAAHGAHGKSAIAPTDLSDHDTTHFHSETDFADVDLSLPDIINDEVNDSFGDDISSSDISLNAAFSGADGEDDLTSEFTDADFAPLIAPEDSTTPQETIAAQKASIARTPEELQAIAAYLSAMGDAVIAESNLKSLRRLKLVEGEPVAAPLVGEYRYYFKIHASLAEEFILADDFGIINENSVTGGTSSASIRFSNSSSFRLNFAHEWRALLQVTGHESLIVKIISINGSSVGTGAGTGLVISAPESLEDWDLSSAYLLVDEGKGEKTRHADRLSLLAQAIDSEAGDIGTTSRQTLLQYRCPELTTRLGSLINARIELQQQQAQTPLSQRKKSQLMVTGLRLQERSEDSLELSPDLDSDHKKAVTTALNYDLSFIVTAAQNQDTTIGRDLLLNLMEKRKSVLFVDRDPNVIDATFKALEQSLEEQEQMAAAYGDPSSAFNRSYRDPDDQNKQQASFATDEDSEETQATAATTEDSATTPATSGKTTAAAQAQDTAPSQDTATAADATYKDGTTDLDSKATAEDNAAAAGNAAADKANSEDEDGDLEAELDELYHNKHIERMLVKWQDDYPVLQLNDLLSGIPAAEQADTHSNSKAGHEEDKSERISLTSHLKKRLALLQKYGVQHQEIKQERLQNLERLLAQVIWLQDSKLEKLAANLQHLSGLKRQRAEHQHKLNHMQQAYDHQHDLLLQALMPQIVELRTPEVAATAKPDELTMAESMDFFYEKPMFEEVESEVKRLWQQIQEDKQEYQQLKQDIAATESMMRQVMFRPIARMKVTQYTRDNTKLSTARAQYQQLLQQQQMLSQSYKDNSVKFNYLLKRLHLLKPQHQLHLKFEHLKVDTTVAIAELTTQIEALHQKNLEMFKVEQDYCRKCGYTLKEQEFNPEAWRELIADFLEVKHDVSSTQFLMDNWRFVADGSLRYLLREHSMGTVAAAKAAHEASLKAATHQNPDALETHLLESTKDGAQPNAQEQDMAAAEKMQFGHDSDENFAKFDVNVGSISKQLQEEQQEFKEIEQQLQVTATQVNMARSAVISQCPVVGAVPHDALSLLGHSFNTVVLNNVHMLTMPDFWLLTTLARERLVIIGDIQQMGLYSHCRGNSLEIRRYLYPSIFALLGVKDWLAQHQLYLKQQAALAATASTAEANPDATHADTSSAAGSALSSESVTGSTATVTSDKDTAVTAAVISSDHAGALPDNLAVITTSALRPPEINTLLQQCYGPWIDLKTTAESNPDFTQAQEKFFAWSKLAPQLRQHQVHLVNTASLCPWMQELTPSDYSEQIIPSILRYDGYNIMSAAFTIALAFKYVSSLMVLTAAEEEDSALTGATSGAATSVTPSGDLDDIDALLAANSPAAASTDLDDIDALLAANGGGAAAVGASASANAGGQDDIDALLAANGGGGAESGSHKDAGAAKAQAASNFKPHLASWVLRDRVRPDIAATPRVIIVTLYPQQSMLLNLILQQHYRRLGFSEDLNLIAISDAATLSNATAPVVMLDLTIDAPYHNGLYFDAPQSDPSGLGIGPQRELFLQQHLTSALAAAQFNFVIVGDILRLLQRSLFKDNVLYSLLHTALDTLKLPLYDAQSALSTIFTLSKQALTANESKAAAGAADGATLALDFKAIAPDEVQYVLQCDFRDQPYSDTDKLMARLIANQAPEEELGLIDRVIREVPPNVDAQELHKVWHQGATSVTESSTLYDDPLLVADAELEVGLYGLNEHSIKLMLRDTQLAQQQILLMSPHLDETRYQTLKPHLTATMSTGRKVIVLTAPNERVDAQQAMNSRRVEANLQEMMVRMVYSKRCYYQGILIDNDVLWLTSFPLLAHCEHKQPNCEIMLRLKGESAHKLIRSMHLPLLLNNLAHVNSCPICGSKMLFNAQHGLLQCSRQGKCNFTLAGTDEVNTQGELLCPSCHAPLSVHVINHGNGKHGFALRCGKCTPPTLHALNLNHLQLPNIKKQIAALKGITLEEVEQYVAGSFATRRAKALQAEQEQPAAAKGVSSK